MADEKVNASPKENKAPKVPSSSGPSDARVPGYTDDPAVPSGDQAAPAHAESTAGEHTQQTVLPGMGEDAPAPSGKAINLPDIQAADRTARRHPSKPPISQGMAVFFYLYIVSTEQIAVPLNLEIISQIKRK